MLFNAVNLRINPSVIVIFLVYQCKQTQRMGRSRRKYKLSKAKVQVGLPRKKPRVFKPAFSLPPKLLHSLDEKDFEWDDEGSVINNYKSFGVVSNPNLLGVRSRTSHIVESDSLQVPPPSDEAAHESELMDTGSDLEEDDLKSALGKQRRDGKSAPPQPLTAIQRIHIGRLVDKYGDDYQSMFRDIKLNPMQHSIARLQKLCKRVELRWINDVLNLHVDMNGSLWLQ